MSGTLYDTGNEGDERNYRNRLWGAKADPQYRRTIRKLNKQIDKQNSPDPQGLEGVFSVIAPMQYWSNPNMSADDFKYLLQKYEVPRVMWGDWVKKLNRAPAEFIMEQLSTFAKTGGKTQ